MTAMDLVERQHLVEVRVFELKDKGKLTVLRQRNCELENSTYIHQ